MFCKISIFIITCLCCINIAGAQVCRDSFPVSIFQNPSFEIHGPCNMQWTGEGGLIDGSSSATYIDVPGWHAANSDNHPRYYNLDCKLPYQSLFDNSYLNKKTGYPGIPLPLPDGNGLFSIEQYNYAATDSNTQENKTKKVYITTCLASPLKAGVTYDFSFEMGFGLFNPNFNIFSGVWSSPSPFNVGLFGRKDCPDFPVQNASPDLSLGCLADRGGWTNLGNVEVHGRNQWVEAYIEFTPTEDITALGIGPSCDFHANIKDTFALYYMDRFVLAEKKVFAFKTITAQSGNNCSGNFVLQAPAYNNAIYQWYRNDSLIRNATDAVYTVPDNAEGYYKATISLPGICYNTLPYPVFFSPLRNYSITKDTMACTATGINLNASWSGVENYLWQDGSRNAIFNAAQSGNYSVTVTDIYGCTQQRTIHATVQNCAACTVYMPNAFTPNGDGKNDVFRPLNTCSNIAFQHYRMSIYNRYGQLIFQSQDAASGWSGTFNSKAAAPGVYIYNMSYNYGQGKPVSLSGTVLLMR